MKKWRWMLFGLYAAGWAVCAAFVARAIQDDDVWLSFGALLVPGLASVVRAFNLTSRMNQGEVAPIVTARKMTPVQFKSFETEPGQHFVQRLTLIRLSAEPFEEIPQEGGAEVTIRKTDKVSLVVETWSTNSQGLAEKLHNTLATQAGNLAEHQTVVGSDS